MVFFIVLDESLASETYKRYKLVSLKTKVIDTLTFILMDSSSKPRVQAFSC